MTEFMDIDFALVMVLLTAGSGAIWLLDRVFLLPGRRERAAHVSADRIPDQQGRDDARASILREPLVVEYAASFFPVFLIVLIIRSFIIEPYQIPTGSMIPTLEIGDFILVNKFAYGIRLPVIGTEIIEVDKPVNGEIMVFIPPHESRYFIKRVIGIPGDVIRYQDKTLYVNGERAEQQFIAQLPPGNPSYLVYDEILLGVRHQIHRDLYRDPSSSEWVVPQGYYFMMGDNRDRSSDSRMWGMVPEENIRGKAIAVWMHKEPGFHLPEFGRNGAIE